MTGPGPSELSISPERVERLINLVFSLAAGRDEKSTKVPIEHQDQFSELEQLLNAFSEEFLEARERAEALDVERQQLISRQDDLIRELSTPVLDVWEGVLVVPLIGEFDGSRAQQVTEALLGRVAAKGAKAVIIDVTGVSGIDTQTAARLMRVIQAIRLLGCRAIISGISPTVAQVLVAQEIELGATTVPNLQAGLRLCLTI
ncbi:MAG: STAS domain-containing protein [Nannocystaceae bacterium]